MAKENATLVINHIDSSHFPTTMAYASVVSDKGYPVAGLTAANFQVVEAGVPAPSVAVGSAVDVDQALATVIVVDVSGSMAGPALEAEKAAATAFVNGLRPQDQASVIAFSTEVRTLVPFTSDKSALSRAINSLEAGGNTALYDALFHSVDLTSSADPTRRVVIFMTDGRNTRSLASPDDGLNLATQLGVPVYVIGLGGDIDRDLLSNVAQKTGGFSMFSPTSQSLRSSYQAISDQLRNQYVITYDSPLPRGARTYSLAITANVGGEKLRAERQFDAAPPAPQIEGLSLHDGQRLEGITPVAVEVQSVLPIALARLVVNGRIYAERPSPPFEFSLDAGRLSPGRQEVEVVATDVAGSAASQRIQVLVPPALPRVDFGSAGDIQGNTRAVQTGDVVPTIPSPSAALSAPRVNENGNPFLGPIAAIGDAWFSLATTAGAVLGVANPLKAQDPVDGIGVALDRNVRNVKEELARSEGPNATQLALREGAGGAMSALRANGRTIVLFGFLLSATMLGLLGAKRAVEIRRQIRFTDCSECGSRYGAREAECPKCRNAVELTRAENRSLGEFLVQNNLLTSDELEGLLQRSEAKGVGLELAALEDGLVSSRELSQARFYLSHSAEMRDRLQGASRVKTQSGARIASRFLRRLPTAGLPVLLLASSVTAWTLTYPLI
ncbi:MAG: hypothetical protein A3F84_22445 [Candidatus Handelsmanbacteria bacterium RIFCSPLOWO2_12_FULL_64_10]|uniref:VWFA domain-containing protein n=1 Tax=Handelsmanbacteria sp. (strain RIFCSPLOWO2_12_FULL_64_10) TaxID=1817868 RepID=A0A1F6CSC6_HANXR|nr:MAG: hypothetical protein A3F84_22445 [Candidatus Handelsmanbacteria bacterium RIFCSPLOWO2_12_FULL_64_10]